MSAFDGLLVAPGDAAGVAAHPGTVAWETPVLMLAPAVAAEALW
jgi:hypothetical protein